jgi:hypothetical protein
VAHGAHPAFDIAERHLTDLQDKSYDATGEEIELVGVIGDADARPMVVKELAIRSSHFATFQHKLW